MVTVLSVKRQLDFMRRKHEGDRMKIRWCSPRQVTSFSHWLYDSFYTHYDVDSMPMEKRGIFYRILGWEWVKV